MRKVETNAVVSAVEALSEGDPDKRRTIEALAAFGGIGGLLVPEVRWRARWPEAFAPSARGRSPSGRRPLRPCIRQNECAKPA